MEIEKIKTEIATLISQLTEEEKSKAAIFIAGMWATKNNCLLHKGFEKTEETSS